MNFNITKGKTASPQLRGFRRPKLSGFGEQLDSFTGPGSSTERKEGTIKAHFKVYDINSASAEDSAGISSRSAKSMSTAIYKGKPQNFTKLRDDHLKKGTLFEDPEFPAVFSSLQITPVPDDEKPAVEKIKWLRPKEIVKAPQLFVNGYTRFDVVQGHLGNCWAVAAMATLTQQPHLFKKVVDEDQSFEEKYAGIFHFSFWEYGKWVDIVIDDRLPTIDGELFNAHSQEDNEFWIALLEKAYAKFYGSYEALLEGNPGEALVDFTGGVSEYLLMQDLKKKYQNNVFKMVLRAFERGSLISAAIEFISDEQAELIQSLGLGVEHAYTVSKMMYIQTSKSKEKIPLVRIRNPWGDETEWNGPWCDNSKEWNDVSEEVKKQIGLTFDHDGEFWMKWDDCETFFTALDICNLTLDSLSKEDIGAGHKKRWEASMIKGAWVQGVTAIGLGSDDTYGLNPQYRITLTRSDEKDRDSNCTLIVSLMQKHRRVMKPSGAEFHFIGFSIFYIPNPESAPKPLTSQFVEITDPVAFPPFRNTAAITYRFELPPGTYCIICSTLHPNKEASFMLRIFSETKNHMEVYDEKLSLGEISQPILEISGRMGSNEEPKVNKDIQQMFWKLSDANLEIHWLELKQILDASMKEETKSKGFTEDACRSILSLSDEDHSGTMDYQEFEKLWIDLKKWKAAFKSRDKENSGTLSGFEIREALNAVGFRINNIILIDIVHRYGNAERKLNFESFILCAIKIKALIELMNSKVSDQSTATSLSLQQLLQCTFFN